MALDSTDYLLRTSFTMSFYTKPFQNVWYFKRIAGAGLASVLVDAFIGDIVPAMEGILPDFVDTTLFVTAESLVDLDDVATGIHDLAGTWASSEAVPYYNTASFETVRSTRQNKRNGRKAIGPLAESMINGPLPVTSYAVVLATFTQAVNADAIDGTSRYRVALPRSIKVDNPNAPPAQIYEIQDLFAMSSFIFKRISTQNSRKDW